MSGTVREFNYPLPAGELWQYCNPNQENVFHKPFTLAHEEVGLANGFMAMKCGAIDWMDDHEVEAEDNPQAAERIEKLPWSFFDYARTKV